MKSTSLAAKKRKKLTENWPPAEKEFKESKSLCNECHGGKARRIHAFSKALKNCLQAAGFI